MSSEKKLVVRDHGPVREIRLARPEVHNALDEELIAQLSAAFDDVRALVGREETVLRSGAAARVESPAPRVVVLTGEGPSFCAGADVAYMRRMGEKDDAANRADARKVSALFHAVRGCPVFTIARVHGAALGGGSGLVAACDFVLAADDARFGFTETQLGIIPAVISPFVIDRIGPARARAFFPTGERFTADVGLQIGLVDRAVPVDQLDAALRGLLKSALSAAPRASRAAKRLIEMVSLSVPLQLDLERSLDRQWREEAESLDGPPTLDPFGLPGEDLRAFLPSDDEEEEEEMDAPVFEQTARWIAKLRGSAEGREGLGAFLEKRKPGWVAEPPEFS